MDRIQSHLMFENLFKGWLGFCKSVFNGFLFLMFVVFFGISCLMIARVA